MRDLASFCPIADALFMVERGARRILYGAKGVARTTDTALQKDCAKEIEEARKLRWQHAKGCSICQEEETNAKDFRLVSIPRSRLRRSA